MVVGVVGLGSVGSAVYNVMRDHHPTVGYDVDGRGSFDQVLASSVVFVCVPTDGLPNGDLDCEAVRSVCMDMSESAYNGLVVIKSTLHPRTMDSLHAQFDNLDLVYMPEFLREKDAEAWFRSPDRLVVGGEPGLAEKALRYFQWVPPSIPRLVMNPLEAEIAKLAHNAYIATKQMTFTCEIERICQVTAVNPVKVMEVIWNDRRIRNPAHLTPGSVVSTVNVYQRTHAHFGALILLLINKVCLLLFLKMEQSNRSSKGGWNMIDCDTVVVLVTTYNRPELLKKRALESILNQTRHHDVIVLVDNSDAEARRRKNISTFHELFEDGVYLVNQRAPGAAGTWNQGLQYIKQHHPSAWVAILDDDDEWTPDHLQTCLSVAKGADAVISGIRTVLDGEVIEDRVPTKLTISDFFCYKSRLARVQHVHSFDSDTQSGLV